MRERLFCSDAARLRGDDNTATAARVDVWLLVEVPITWGREPLTDAAIPDPVRDALRNACNEIPRARIVFIRRRVESLGPVRVFVVRSAPVLGIVTVDLPSIIDVADVPFATLAAEVQPAAQPLVLVCTHGQHDSCCGRRGYPLYDALRQRSELDVWQCSHIGGDRFAANALVLPWGLYYGPVEPREADALTDTILRDEIFLPAYRGRSSISRPVQAAETFVRRTTGLLGRDSLRLTARENVAEHVFRIHLRDSSGTTHHVTLEQVLSDEPSLLTCSAKVASPIPRFVLVDYTTA
ncbi:MAG TPA: sucrase ferredoxin [Thermoanaerobaculia bacterium]